MSTVLTGNDTIKINDRVFADFGHGEIAKISYANQIAAVKKGRNGNAIISSNQSGDQATLELRVLRGSSDDKWLNSEIQKYKGNPDSYVLLSGEITKRLGDGAGNVTSDAEILSGGVILQLPEKMTNVEGDVEQAITIYTIEFAQGNRALA